MVGLGNVSDEFHEVFDLNLVSGRWFSEEDAALDWEPLVITQPLSEALFGREDPIGQQVEEWGGMTVTGGSSGWSPPIAAAGNFPKMTSSY